MRKNKCPLCGELKCEKRLCEKVISYHGYFNKEGLQVTEAGKKLYSKLNALPL